MNIQSSGERGWTPLHVAAAYGNGGIVKLLLDAGSDPKARDEHGRTPLHAAPTDVTLIR